MQKKSERMVREVSATISDRAGGEGLRPAGWSIRAYRAGDALGMVAVANATYAADKLDKKLSVKNMEHSLAMPRSDPPRQVIIAEAPGLPGLPDGTPAGYGRILPMDDKAQDQRIYQFNLSVHPAARGIGLEREIARKLMGMAREVEADPATEAMGQVFVLALVSAKNSSLRPVLDELGLRDVRQHWVMECSLETPIDVPKTIAGTNMRTYRRPEDNGAAREAYNSSFVDHFEFHPFTQEIWDYMAGTPDMRPELSWVAEVEEQPGTIAGFCMCEIKSEDNKQRGRSKGWISLLGTIRGWRGKGLGRALLLHGLRSLKSASVQTALLGVDAESLTGANRLYESVGFQVRDHEILYKCALGEVL
jgi:mycothiol synthase